MEGPECLERRLNCLRRSLRIARVADQRFGRFAQRLLRSLHVFHVAADHDHRRALGHKRLCGGQTGARGAANDDEDSVGEL